MIKIGIFGLIGSGKTEVSRMFAEKGAIVISADEIGKEVVDSNPDVLEALKQKFGTDIIDDKGQLKRRDLGRRVFASESERKKLDAIVHPPLLESLSKAISDAENRGTIDILVVDAALILNWGIGSWFDYLICVTAPEKRQLERLQSAGFSEEEAMDRINSQIPKQRQIEAADFIIENDGSIDDLREKVSILYKDIISLKK